MISKGTGDMVKVKRNVLTGALVLGLSVPAVTAAGQLGAVPSALAAPAQARQAAARNQPAMRRPRIQLGAGVDLYAYPGENFTKASAAEIAYLKALHANSVTVSFPFFMHGRNANSVYARKSTPTPVQLGIFGRAALKAGIYVALRPLLSNDSIGVARNTWRPKNLRAWFSSYQKFLLPYADMARRAGIPRLYVGAEFQEFGKLVAVDQARQCPAPQVQGGAGLRQQRAQAEPGHRRQGRAAVGGLLPGHDQDAGQRHRRPADQGLGGLGPGHAARHRAERGRHRRGRRARTTSPGSTSGRTRRWTPPCRPGGSPRPAARPPATHMGGIYFWAIGFGAAELTTSPSAKNQGAWEKGPAEKAAAACFKQLRG